MARSNLEVVLEFLRDGKVWLTLCVAVLIYLIGNGTLDVALLRQVLNVVGEFLQSVNPF